MVYGRHIGSDSKGFRVTLTTSVETYTVITLKPSGSVAEQLYTIRAQLCCARLGPYFDVNDAL